MNRAAAEASSSPAVGVVIPLYGHPALAVEAIESALRQQTNFEYRIVLVNDGCPLRETAELCRAYVRMVPSRIMYVHRRNGGLSAARNTGVEVALAAWPTIDALYFLDADNRIGPFVLQRSYDALIAHPEAGWVYPDIPMFGSVHEYHDMSGPPSLLQLLSMNYSEAGSLVRRGVFDRGIRFDEGMRLGFEDWEFWWQCAAAGFRGHHVADLGFQYRKRAESMLQDSERDREQILAYMRRKHGELFTLRRAMELEQEELPRYALHVADGPGTILTSDPMRRDSVIPIGELGQRLARWGLRPQHAPFPPFVVVTSEGFLKALDDCGLTRSVLWLLEARLVHTEADIVVACLQCAASPEVRIEVQSCAGDMNLWLLANSGLAMLRSAVLRDWLTASEDGRMWPDAVQPTIDVTRVDAVAPHLAYRSLGTSLERLLVPLAELRGPVRDPPRLDWDQGKRRARPAADATEIVSQLFSASPLFPAVLDPSRIHVGFPVPICDLGGVERVAHNLAREARRRGWVPHLFVIGSGRMRMLAEFREVFETTTLVGDPELITRERLVGLLGAMDVVINNHCYPVYAVAGQLRRLGVKVFAQLHVIDLSDAGVPCGFPYVTLDYEHALDGVLVVSRHLWNWCRAWGIPEEKLSLVPNASSYDVSESVVTATMAERARRTGDEPLRALFIGRFDRQKGLDRLEVLVCRTQESGRVEWRVVGKRVLTDEATPSSLDPVILPPAVSARQLTALFRWADVLVMTSRYEGSPLTILEAQRLGCVVLSTNVGAVDELVEAGRQGLLFDEGLSESVMVDDMLDALLDLHGNRRRLLAMSEASAAVARERTWIRSFSPFAEAVERQCGRVNRALGQRVPDVEAMVVA